MNWKIPELSKQFESLHALANLLVVVPENLSEACASQLLVNFLNLSEPHYILVLHFLILKK